MEERYMKEQWWMEHSVGLVNKHVAIYNKDGAEREERHKMLSRAWSQANKEKVKESRKKFLEKNKERMKEYQKEYQEKYKEKMKEYQKEYQKRYREAKKLNKIDEPNRIEV